MTEPLFQLNTSIPATIGLQATPARSGERFVQFATRSARLPVALTDTIGDEAVHVRSLNAWLSQLSVTSGFDALYFAWDRVMRMARGSTIHEVVLVRRQLKQVDWDAVAGILAAVLAFVLHFLHVIEEGVLIMITLVLMALLFLRDLRRESETELIAESVQSTEQTVDDLRTTLDPGDLELVGPGDLRPRSERFSENARGEMIWFNVCLLMFVPQDLFDTLLRPAIENPDVSGVQFVLDESERERWETQVEPKVAECAHADSVREPVWRDLDDNVSFILRGTKRGETDAC